MKNEGNWKTCYNASKNVKRVSMNAENLYKKGIFQENNKKLFLNVAAF